MKEKHTRCYIMLSVLMQIWCPLTTEKGCVLDLYQYRGMTYLFTLRDTEMPEVA